MNQRWYCRISGQVKGPLEFPALQSFVSTGELRGTDDVRTTRSQEWSKAADVEGLFPEHAHADDLAAMLAADDRPTPRPASRDAACYCRIGGQVRGPMTFEDVAHLASSRLLMPQDDVRLSSDADWMRAENIVGLFDVGESPASAGLSEAPSEPPSIHEFQVESPSAGAARSIPSRSGSPPAPAVSTAYGETADGRTWYYELNGHEIGPLTFEAISELAHSGRLTRQDKVRNGERAPWDVADAIVGLFPDAPTPDAEPEPAPARKPAPKAKTPAERPRPAQKPAGRPSQQKRRSKSPSVDADDLAEQLLAEATEESPSIAEHVPTPRPAHREPVAAPQPPPTVVPTARTAQRAPAPRARKSEPFLANLNIGVKQIAGVGGMLAVVAFWFWGLPLLSFGNSGPEAELNTICLQLLELYDRENLQAADWNSFKDQALPKVKELATQMESDADDPESKLKLRCCTDYVPRVLEAGPSKLSPELSKIREMVEQST